MNDIPKAELDRLQLGFVPLLDCALPVVAREGGFFAEEGIEVTLLRQNAWATLRDKVAAGLLDGAHMLAPLPLAMSLGLGRAPCDMLAPMLLSRNGNTIVLSKALADASHATLTDDPTTSASALGDYLRHHPHEHRPRLAMVYPYSCHHYQLSYWLDLGHISPDRHVELIAMPPPQVVDAMRDGTIDGFCVGEPWGSLAQAEGVGRLVATSAQLWPDHAEKVLGVTRSWARRYPTTLTRVMRALLRASEWLATDRQHADQALAWLALPPYLDRSVAHLSHFALDSPPIRQRLFGPDMLRPEPRAMEHIAEYIDQHMRHNGRQLDRDTVAECYSPVHFDRLAHQ
ncbi:CmpA/NrtA family ABC transporter substrate-binding protein [Aidingimonas lacisalsi]|uniref:CmpA/NrtA family ABC transporter substrate-binding protein n=1 Tax=Aidingimonas lacisalsi TaxID=2604086 RepID=UPI0011D21830|nr:CmpA/NrtA family ABC transporter substrate-binding protein [Aidingimonas lacisalsi]